MKPYIIYARRSTDDADNQKNSLEYQDAACRAFAKQNGILLTEETLDPVIRDGIIKERHSGFKSNAISVSGLGLVEYQIERPKFMQMISWLMEGKYAGVVVLCWDRISRNEKDDIVIKELIKHHQIRIQFVQAEYDLTSSSGELHMDIDGMFARHHSRVTSEKVRNTFSKLRKEGMSTHQACIGYLDKGSNNKEFDPERAPLVIRAYEQYDSGEWSLNQLTKWLVKQGLTTKPRRRKRTNDEILMGVEITEKTSRPLSMSSVEYMLKNQYYIGTIVGDDGFRVQGGHPPLIDEALFWRVQERLKENCVTVQYMDKPFFSYRGIAKCSCGRIYSPYMKKGHIYYNSRCKAGCSNPTMNISEDVIVSAVQSVMDQIAFSDEEILEIESGAKSGLGKAAKERDKALHDLATRKTRINRDLDYLKENKVSLLREKTYTPSDFSTEYQKLVGELKEIDALHGAHTETEEEMLDFVLMVSEVVKNASRLYKYATSQEKREIAHMLLSELVLVDGKMASYKAKDEFVPLLERHSVQIGSSGWDRTNDLGVNSALLCR